VLAISRPRFNSLADYASFERKKFLRLMLPFISVSLIYLAIKTPVFGLSMSDVRYELMAMAIAPLGGPAPHLWFLYTLMAICLFWPLLDRLARGENVFLLIAALVALAVLAIRWPLTDRGNALFCFSNITWNVPMFALGYWYGVRFDGRIQLGWRGFLIAMALAVSLLSAYAYLPWPDRFDFLTVRNACRMVGACAWVLAVLWFCGKIVEWGGGVCTLLSRLGLLSYDVYLLHVAFAAHPIVMLVSKLHPGTVLTYVLFFASIPMAIAIPYVMGLLIRRVRPLAFVVLGVPLRRGPSAPQLGKVSRNA